MSMEKFGRTLFFAVFVLMLLFGAKMAIKIADPYTRKISTSLADTLKTI